jgi:hypothetical protein
VTDAELRVPAVVLRVARDLQSTDPRVRSRAIWSLLKPGPLEWAVMCQETLRFAGANAVVLPEEISGRAVLVASILDRLPELQRDPDMRVRVAANEVSTLVRAWEDIEAGRAERPLLEGVPVMSIGVLKVYRDVRSHWLMPLLRLAKRLGATLYARLPRRAKTRL